MMDINAARETMLKQQIRAWDVLDDEVLDLIASTPREMFVPAGYRQVAFADENIPLGHDQVMMSPGTEGRLIQALRLKPDDKILEVGTGSGYLTALLAKASRQVYSIDVYEDFLTSAKAKLAQLAITNVTLQAGNAVLGWVEQQPYDVICLTGSLPRLPKSFQYQLNIGGRLFAILGNHPVMEAVLVVRTDEHSWQTQFLFETNMPRLLYGPSETTFLF